MQTYCIFIVAFVLSILGMVVFFGIYLSAMMHFMQYVSAHHEPDPTVIFKTVFSAPLIISFACSAIAGLVYRILGIVYIANNPELQGGEQALWVIGFLLMGFVAAIVFMALCKSRRLLPLYRETPAAPKGF